MFNNRRIQTLDSNGVSCALSFTHMLALFILLLTTRNLCAVDEYKVKGKNWNAINMTLILQCDQRKQLSYWVLPFSLCLFLIGDWRNDVHTYTCKWIRIKILYLALRHCGLKKLVRNTHQWYHSVLLRMWMKPGKLWILIFFRDI